MACRPSRVRDRFQLHADGEAVEEAASPAQQYRDEVHALATDFVMGVLFGRAFARPVEDALAAPPPLGLRMPLASGFGRARSQRGV